MKIIFLLLLLPLSAWALPKELYLVNYCTVFDHAGGTAGVFPGRFCTFLPDGRIISATQKVLRMIGVEGEILWELPIWMHHQMNLTNDGKKLLLLGTESRKIGERNVRVDKFFLISLEGKILSEVDTLELLKDKMPLPELDLAGESKIKFEADFERTHFNSIYEIPANKSKLPYLKAGNIVVNSMYIGTCVLSPDLKTVLNCKTFPDSVEHQVHDVQITEEGRYLYFNNKMAGEKINASSIDEWDPVKKKLTFRFKANPAGMFYASRCGGVQALNKDLLMASHVQTGIYVINRKTNKLVETMSVLEMTPEMLNAQQFHAYELESFFKARKHSGK